MEVVVTAEDFQHARETLPGEAPDWMVQEFAANYALQRVFPRAIAIRVDSWGILVDDDRYVRPPALYRRLTPYRFRLTDSPLSAWVHHLRSNVMRGQ